jgi:hypothetical protein
MTVHSEFHLKDGDLTVRRVQDVESIIERNKFLQGEGQTWAGTFRHIGTIPNVILEKWMNEECAPNLLAMSGDEFGQFVKRKLNDPDWRWLKTTSGRV